MIGPERVEVLGVPVHCVESTGILGRIANWSVQHQKRMILYVNAHCLNIACVDKMYYELLTCADLVYPDGISVVWASRLLGGCQLHKVTGADWINLFCDFAEVAGLRVYILAGKPGIAARAQDNLLQKWPRLKIVGAYDGYFKAKPEADILRDSSLTDPQVLFVGMGTPDQEKWIASHRAEIPAPVCWAVGALFDYVAGVEARVPSWMNALALEWFWRFLMDPRGKWRRYFIGNPLFVFRVLRQKLGH